jgi:hypothetical protein
MKTLRDLYDYRQLAGRCEGGDELSMEEIQVLTITDTNREPVRLRALLRGPKVADWVDVSELGAQSLVCHECPWMEEGQAYEVIFDDEEAQQSFRFKAIVQWTREAGEDLDVCLRFTGAALHLRRGARVETQSANTLLHRFAA